MNKKIILSTILLSSFLISCENHEVILDDFTYNNPNVSIVDTLQTVENEKAHIVFLFGQSNADGVSHNEYLKMKDPEKYNEYSAGYENVLINYVNDGYNTSSSGAFIKCNLGKGYSSATFGPEMGIAEQMHQKYPEEKTFIIKWTWGGTSLSNQWLNGNLGRGDLYNDSMDLSLKSLKYLSSKGYSLSLDGICWMQGENDSLNRRSDPYYYQTRAFVMLLRHDLREYQEEIRFIDAGINEQPGIWPHPESINKAKKQFASESSLNIYIDPTKLGLSSTEEPIGQVDYAHYDALSMVKLGQAFGSYTSL